MTAFTRVEEWVKDQWTNSTLGDKRRNKRIIKLANNMIKCPDKSLPVQNKGFWSETKAGYRFLNTDDITHENLDKNIGKILKWPSQALRKIRFYIYRIRQNWITVI